ncbi:MAG TPA: hypothetical protein DD417_08525 [Elusimicrobia bacterium]|nr:hypothetical protein [Elusimicrobiota bacterium]
MMDLFRTPAYLGWTALAVLAGAALWFWSARRRRAISSAFAHPDVLRRLFPQEALGPRRVKYGLRLAALALMLLALAGPQWGVELVASRAKTTQVLLAVDTSSSMLVEDLKPNRIERTKNALAMLIEELKESRVGIIVFAGEAFVQCPITTDLQAARSLLHRITADMIPRPGTAVGKAINLATGLLAKYPGHKALVLLTDGEDHESEPLLAAQAAAEAGIRIYIIGIGTPEGEPIPLKDDAGHVVGYKKDRTGKTVISRLGEAELIQIAAATQGAYFRATTGEKEVYAVLREIEGLDKAETQSAAANRYKNRFRFPLLAAFLVLLLEMLLPELRTARFRRKKTGDAPPAATAAPLAALLFLAACGPASAQTPATPSGPGTEEQFHREGAMPSGLRLWKGNSRYRKEDFGEALKEYQKADPGDPKTRFNAGDALYKLGDLDTAQQLFESATDPKSVPRGMAPKAYYNLGNTLFRKKQFKEAAEAYKRCLLLDPSEEDCRHNLVLALRPRQPQKDDPKKPDPQKQDKKDEPDKKNDKEKPPEPKERPKPQGMSREDAERILQAVKEKEDSAQRRQAELKQQAAKEGQHRPEVDW